MKAQMIMAKDRKRKSQRLDTTFHMLSGNIPAAELSDEMERSSFAEGIIQLIANYPHNDCMVIGVEGGWGQGKSYAIEIIRRKIKGVLIKKKSIKWIEFNPWLFSDREHLARIFLTEIAKNLRPSKVESVVDKFFAFTKPVARFISKWIKHQWLVNTLIIIASSILLLAIIVWENLAKWLGVSTVGAVVIGSILLILQKQLILDKKDILEELSESLNDYAESIEGFEKITSSMSLVELKENIASILLDDELPYSRIVIAVEDLDRLTPDEVRLMVQLMRMVASFPKVTYLVGYDRSQVIRALGEMAGGHATPAEAKKFGVGYLQKIVQASYQLPNPPDNAVAEIIFSKFYSMVNGIYGEDYHTTPYWQSAAPLIAELIGTVRDGDRIINRALLLVTLLKEKSNPIDVLACAYLMEYQENVWQWLWQNRNRILSGGDKLVKSQRTYIGAPPIPEEGYLQDQVIGGSLITERVTNLLQVIIPSFNYSNGYTHSIEERALYSPLGSRDYFESYFKGSITEASEIQRLVPKLLQASSSKGRKSILDEIRSYGNEGLSLVMRDLTEMHTSQKLDWPSVCLPLLSELGKAYDDMPRVPGMGGRYPANRIYWLTVAWINSLEPEKRGHAFLELISKWLKNDVKYLPFTLSEKVGQEEGWLPYEDNESKSSKPIQVTLNDKERSKLQEMINYQLGHWTSDQAGVPILKHPQASLMMFLWLRWNPKLSRLKIDGWLADDWRIFEFLSIMVDDTYTLQLELRQGVVSKSKMASFGLKKLTGMGRDELIERIREATLKNPSAAEVFADVIRSAEDLPDF